MPTYEYLCADCGKTFEAIQKITEPALDKCTLCGGSNVKRLISATAFHLKGGGWYKTDYASPSGQSTSGSTSSASGTESASPSTEKKAETKSEPAKTEAPKPSSSSGGSD